MRSPLLPHPATDMAVAKPNIINIVRLMLSPIFLLYKIPLPYRLSGKSSGHPAMECIAYIHYLALYSSCCHTFDKVSLEAQEHDKYR